ncbi:hypothetical protein EJB05_36327, partial [Eragrostis curvula]
MMMESNPYFAVNAGSPLDASKRARMMESGPPYFGGMGSSAGGAGGSFYQPFSGNMPGAGVSNGIQSFPCVRLRGLPFDCNEIDICKFFVGLDIVDCLLVHKNGRFTGEAFVVFPAAMQAEFALHRNRQNMGRRYVEVFRCKKQEYYNAIASEVNQGGFFDSEYRHSPPPPRPKKPAEDKSSMEYTEVLKLRGLPYSATVEDIIKFFVEYELTEENVHIGYRPDGKATGEAFVEFPTAEVAKTAMCKDKMTIGTRNRQLMDTPFGPRWKKGIYGKDLSTLAAANPMSDIVAQLQASLRSCECTAILSGCNAVLHVGAEQAALLNRSAFGQAVAQASATGEAAHFQVGPEETFYLLHALQCITVVKPEPKETRRMSEEDVFAHLCSARPGFPELYKAYSHLRRRNWVVRSGLQYGADFVAYRHHPALVHSEYAVVVAGDRRGRLAAWPELLCALRAAGSVAKTLLVLTVASGGDGDLNLPACLREMTVHERVVARWVPQQCREGDRCAEVDVTSSEEELCVVHGI